MKTMGFAWMPTVNTELKYEDPWRPGKQSCFNLKKKLTDVLADMTIYHCRLLIAKSKTTTKLSEDYLREYFGELQSLAYMRAYNGLRCWKPAYGLNLYVKSHVRFAAMTLATRYKNSTVLVPSETVSGLSTTFQESMELAEAYMKHGADDDAARIYEQICLECPDDEPEEVAARPSKKPSKKAS